MGPLFTRIALSGDMTGFGRGVEGTRKDTQDLKPQSGYEGAALVNPRPEPSPFSISESLNLLPGHAEVTTLTTDGTSRNFLAHYAAPAEDGTPEYHQYQSASANVRDIKRAERH